MRFELPQLEYEYDSLEPHIDKQTMIIHHTKHHQAYTDKLNSALEKYPELKNKTCEELLSSINSIPEEIKTAIRNNGGGFINHNLFWKILRKDTVPSVAMSQMINESFGSLEMLKEKLSLAATAVFGSGWAWVVVGDGKLDVLSTPNQDSPLMQGKKPVLGIDVWEHAYYLKYQNKRADYVSAFFSVINWEQVEKNIIEAAE